MSFECIFLKELHAPCRGEGHAFVIFVSLLLSINQSTNGNPVKKFPPPWNSTSYPSTAITQIEKHALDCLSEDSIPNSIRLTVSARMQGLECIDSVISSWTCTLFEPEFTITLITKDRITGLPNMSWQFESLKLCCYMKWVANQLIHDSLNIHF